MVSRTKKKLKQVVRNRRKQIDAYRKNCISVPWAWDAVVLSKFGRAGWHRVRVGYIDIIGIGQVLQVEGERGFWRKSLGGKPVFYEGSVVGVARLSEAESDILLRRLEEIHEDPPF